MDKLWDRNPSKSDVIGCCDGDEKMNDHAEPTKVERPPPPKNTIKTDCFVELLNYAVPNNAFVNPEM